MSPDRNQAISRSAPRLRSSSSIRCCFQPSSFLNPWYWKSLDQLEQLDTLGRISSGELCQRPMQCWHRGYDRSAAANRSSILDKHLETLSTLSFFSPFFLFSLPSRFSYSTHSKRVTVFTLSRIVSTIRRYDFPSSLIELIELGTKKKKKLQRNDDSHFIDFIYLRKKSKKIECQSIVVAKRRGCLRRWRGRPAFLCSERICDRRATGEYTTDTYHLRSPCPLHSPSSSPSTPDFVYNSSQATGVGVFDRSSLFLWNLHDLLSFPFVYLSRIYIYIFS